MTSEPSNVWTTLAFVGLCGVFLALVGYLVVSVNRRKRAGLAARRALIETAVPQELRFEPVPLAWRIAGYASMLLASVVAGLAFKGGWAGVVVMWAVCGPMVAVTIRSRKRQTERVIAAVRERAPHVEQDELERLIDGLELSHGKGEMRELRELLP
jgi:apolipoprotein N-acyltransferase